LSLPDVVIDIPVSAGFRAAGRPQQAIVNGYAVITADVLSRYSLEAEVKSLANYQVSTIETEIT
jgi:hypothetical protein